jgi:hypothetical protein
VAGADAAGSATEGTASRGSAAGFAAVDGVAAADVLAPARAGAVVLCAPATCAIESDAARARTAVGVQLRFMAVSQYVADKYTWKRLAP